MYYINIRHKRHNVLKMNILYFTKGIGRGEKITISTKEIKAVI